MSFTVFIFQFRQLRVRKPGQSAEIAEKARTGGSVRTSSHIIKAARIAVVAKIGPVTTEATLE